MGLAARGPLVLARELLCNCTCSPLTCNGQHHDTGSRLKTKTKTTRSFWIKKLFDRP